MKKYKIISILLMLLLSLTAASGCAQGNQDTAKSASAEISAGDPVLPDGELAAADMFSSRDKEIDWSDTEYAEIKLSDAGSATDSGNVKIDGSTVTISAAGTYVLSGSLANGQIIVDAAKEDKLQLVLNGVSINCDTSAAIYVKQADKVFITLADKTENTLANTKDYVAIDDNNIDSVIFSKEDLTLNGNGSLAVSAGYGHGIVSKDDLVLTGGTYSIASASHGLAGKNSVRIAAGSFTITSGKDGVHAENADDASLGFIYIASGSFDITAETDGLDAASVLQVEDGTFQLTTGGGSQNSSSDENGNQRPDWGGWGQDSSAAGAAAETPSAKGFKADGNLLIKSGAFVIDSSDDSLHSNANIFINAGDFTLASGDDGFHADTQAVINGGTITISKSYEGIEGQSIDITGGEISITASDDGLNAAGGNDASGRNGRPGMDNFTADADCYIKISGGKMEINASGDGIDSNGNLSVSGGETYVSGPTSSGNGALDYQGSAEVTGGIFIAAGSSGMAQNFGTSSTQGAILCNLSNRQNAGTAIALKDQDGNVLASYAPPKEYSSVVISAPQIKAGAAYTLETGTEVQSITMSGLIYGNGGGMGGMRGNTGDRQPNRPSGGDIGGAPGGRS